MKRLELGSWKGACGIVAMLTAVVAGCVDADDDEPPTWESYLEAATTEFEGQPIYIVDGDLAVTRDELRQSYDALVAEYENRRLGVGTVSSDSTVLLKGKFGWFYALGRYYHDELAPDIWARAYARDLRYCVSDEFGELKARAVAEMDQATRDWEQHANFDFRYVPAEDPWCRAGNSNVVFVVRPWADGYACSFFPSGNACVERSLMMDFYYFDRVGKGSLGIFRHELGHILGLQHENIRAPNPDCRKGEGGSYLNVTAYDTSSVMHYPCGATNDARNLVITELDAEGIRKLYGAPRPPSPPRSWWNPWTWF